MNSYFQILQSYISLLQEMYSLENDKLNAIAINDVDALDKFMKDEQVLAMKLKNLDIKRQKKQDELGFGNSTITEIMTQISEEDKEKLSKIYTSLNSTLSDVKKAIDCGNKYIELHLYALNELIKPIKHLAKDPKNKKE
jgi:hypothetical protein